MIELRAIFFKLQINKRIANRELNSEEGVGGLSFNADLLGQFEYKWLKCCLIIVWPHL